MQDSRMQGAGGQLQDTAADSSMNQSSGIFNSFLRIVGIGDGPDSNGGSPVNSPPPSRSSYSPATRKISFTGDFNDNNGPRANELQSRRMRQPSKTDETSFFSLPSLNLNLSGLLSFGGVKSVAANDMDSPQDSSQMDENDRKILGEAFAMESSEVQDRHDLTLTLMRSHAEVGDERSTPQTPINSSSPMPSPVAEKRLSLNTRLSRRPSQSPISSNFKRAESKTSLHPITLHSIAREAGESDALRAVSQRQMRDTSQQYQQAPSRLGDELEKQATTASDRQSFVSFASTVSGNRSRQLSHKDAPKEDRPADHNVERESQVKPPSSPAKTVINLEHHRANGNTQITPPRALTPTPLKQVESASPLRRKSILSRIGLSGSTRKENRDRRNSAASFASSTSSMPLNSPSVTINTLDSGYLGSVDNRRRSISSMSDASELGQTYNKPRTVKTKLKNKTERDFPHLFLAQELQFQSVLPSTPSKPTPSPNSDDSTPTRQSAPSSPNPQIRSKKPAVWALSMSVCGSFLAAAGHDGIIRIWQLRTSESPIEEGSGEAVGLGRDPSAQSTCSNQRKKTYLEAPVFERKPVRELHGHKSDVLDLSWSKNNFLLSSSMDKTVRLWHASRDECLCTFHHSDFVTSVAFREHRSYLDIELRDCRLRLWCIPEKSLRAWTELPHLITAVAFPSNGRVAICGTYTGHVAAFETENLRFITSFEAKSARGKNAKGRKVTGMQTLCQPGARPRLLVTTNDSRIRIFNVTDQSLEFKYSGHENVSSQIRASFSEDGQHIISGSEDGHVYIWSSGYVDGEPMPSIFNKKAKAAHESFQAESSITTCAIFVSDHTKQLLREAGDPLLSAKDSATESCNSARDAIIICADDNSGTIRVYRNSPTLSTSRNSTLQRSVIPSQLHKVASTSDD